jgi:hypothetical protein
MVQSTKVAGCAVHPISVDLVQIQQEERLGLTAKSHWAEVLIKEAYAAKSGRAITACWRGRMRNACAKRVEPKKRFIMRGMVNVKKRQKEKSIWSGMKLMRSPCSQRFKTISVRFSCGR